MQEYQKHFKRPPKRYQPRGLSILYEDRDILVVDKVSGLLTVSNDKVRDNTAYSLLNEYRKKSLSLMVHKPSAYKSQINQQLPRGRNHRNSLYQDGDSLLVSETSLPSKHADDLI